MDHGMNGKRIYFYFFGGLESTQLARQLHQERIQMEVQSWGSPEAARLEGTPTVHVTCLYVSWYVRVVDTHSI